MVIRFVFTIQKRFQQPKSQVEDLNFAAFTDIFEPCKYTGDIYSLGSSLSLNKFWVLLP